MCVNDVYQVGIHSSDGDKICFHFSRFLFLRIHYVRLGMGLGCNNIAFFLFLSHLFSVSVAEVCTFNTNVHAHTFLRDK